MEGLTLFKIISLGAVDAVNPCALAVLSLILISILTHNPKNKRSVLMAGLSFTLAVFITYLFYGLVLVEVLGRVGALMTLELLLYRILGILAIIIGILQVKDFLWYSPGTIGTEMPKFLRPKVKKLISEVTSPRGAFLVGIFVTVFLLPCTIGPYIVAAGSLAKFSDLIRIIYYLVIYNLIFIIPMASVTLIIYGGMATVSNFSEWKDENIRNLHLISGSLILAIGITLILEISEVLIFGSIVGASLLISSIIIIIKHFMTK